MDEHPIERPEFVHRLWNGLQGIAALAVGTPRLSNGKYGHERMTHTYFDYSADAARLLAFVKQAENGSDDVYFCPALRTSRSVRRNTATASRFLWADVDRPIEQVAPALEWMASAADGIVLVRSGSGGAHVYVPLSHATSMIEVEPLNQRLAAYLGGDRKWHDNALLRLPGTLNHKHRVLRGGPPTPVRAVTLGVGGRHDLAGVDPSDLAAALGSNVPSRALSMGADQDRLPAPEPFTPPAFLQEIIDEVPGENRSLQTYRLVFACIESGATDAEVHWAAMGHRPTTERFDGREQHVEAEIVRLIRKARAEHPHPGQSCTAARCPNAPRPASQRHRQPVRRNSRAGNE
mgnify:CR=1 FL=1